MKERITSSTSSSTHAQYKHSQTTWCALRVLPAVYSDYLNSMTTSSMTIGCAYFFVSTQFQSAHQLMGVVEGGSFAIATVLSVFQSKMRARQNPSRKSIIGCTFVHRFFRSHSGTYTRTYALTRTHAVTVRDAHTTRQHTHAHSDLYARLRFSTILVRSTTSGTRRRGG